MVTLNLNSCNASEAGNIKRYLDLYKDVDVNNLGKLKYSNLNIPCSKSNKIPFLIHHVWLTPSSAPKELREQDIKNIINTKKVFSPAEENKFFHIVWVNDLSLIPKSVLKLEHEGFIIMPIEGASSSNLLQKIENIIDQNLWGNLVHLKSYYLANIPERVGLVMSENNNDFKLPLQNEILILIEKKLFGMASDILRYVLLEKFGGLYLDLNFVLNKTIEDKFYCYDFFAQTINRLHGFLENSIIAAKPHHKIFTIAIEDIKQKIDQTNLLNRNLLPNEVFLETIQNTYNPFFQAYFKDNDNSSINVVFPAECKFDNIENIELIKEKWGEEVGNFFGFIMQQELCQEVEFAFGGDLKEKSWLE